MSKVNGTTIDGVTVIPRPGYGTYYVSHDRDESGFFARVTVEFEAHWPDEKIVWRHYVRQPDTDPHVDGSNECEFLEGHPCRLVAEE